MDAFAPSLRRRIAELTSLSTSIEDLADSFPALLFALATDYGTAEQRAQALSLVVQGAPLKSVAQALGLAWWLRKLPPSAFSGPLAAFPDDADFAFRISNSIPRERRLLPGWLTRVGHAQEACGSAYALWLARQTDLASCPEELSLLMAAWAWYGQHPGHLGSRLLRMPWHPEMSARRAREELSIWHQRTRLAESLGAGIATPWLTEGKALGLSFVALRTVEDYVAESEALDNCLDRYADQVYAGGTAVFSIRKGTRRLACVEIGLHPSEVSMPVVTQLKAARNRQAPAEIWQATFAWLGSQDLAAFAPRALASFRRDGRQRVWAPYLSFLAGTRHEEALRRLVLKRGVGSRRRAVPPRRRVAGV